MNAIATSSKWVGAGLLMLGLAFAGNATAAPTYSSDVGGNQDGLSESDVTFEMSNADDCYGLVEGNPSTTPGATLEFDKWGDPFTFLVKDDGGGDSGLFEGVSFSLNVVDLNETSGAWELSWSGEALPTTLDFVVNLKGATQYASYLFEGVYFDVDPDTGSGTFQMFTFVNPGGQLQTPELSNMSIFARLGEPPTQVPAPGALGLMGLGLIGMGLFARRRQLR